MPTYVVIRKSDQEEVYRYTNGEKIEWVGMEFSTHDHVQQSEEPPIDPVPLTPSEWHMYVGPFFDRFGAYKLPILASTDPLVQAIIKDATVRKYIDLYGRRTELAQAIGLLQSKGFAVDATAVLDVKPSIDEVFRG